jgi:hypothetical protein
MITLITDWMYLNETCREKDNACVKHRREEGYKVIHSRISLNFKSNTILYNPKNTMNPDSRQDAINIV